MIPFIIVFIVAFTVISCLIAVVIAERNAKKAHEKHLKNVASPYRIVLSGMCEYRIQRYEYLKQSKVRDKEDVVWETPKSDWQWVAIGDRYEDLEDAKKKYCSLMAAFRKKSETETETFVKRWADVSRTEVHSEGRDQVVDLADCEDLINQMVEGVKKRAARKRKKDGEGTEKAAVAE